MKYKNPILRGFYPDPSICRVGEDFYLVNSTFEFFPGVPVFHSKDLVNWKQAGHCISRPNQLVLNTGRQSNSGIFAPSIRYHKGIYYMITTNITFDGKDDGNFFVWTRDPFSEWSDPIFLGTPGIDPSLFFDDDKSYYIGTCDDGIYICEIDLDVGKIVTNRQVIWKGTGGSYPEGPHIYKRNGWYYLLISEGGTERSHMITMARSTSIAGPYEACPNNPVLTNRSLGLSIESVGHADMVEDKDGNWWAVCLGTRTFSYPPKHNLGRETMLVPVDWSGDWPVFGNNGRLEEEMEVTGLLEVTDYVREEERSFRDDFTKNKMDLTWNWIYNPDDSLWKSGDGSLKLYGNEKSLSDAEVIAWLGRRQQHHRCSVKVTLSFDAVNEGEEAGITAFTNNRHHYEAALTVKDGVRKLIFKRKIGRLWRIENELEYTGVTVTLLVEADKENYTFSYYTTKGEKKLLGDGETIYLTTEVGGHFTGNYIALYAAGNGKKCVNPAIFTDYSYSGLE